MVRERAAKTVEYSILNMEASKIMKHSVIAAEQFSLCDIYSKAPLKMQGLSKKEEETYIITILIRHPNVFIP